MICCCAFAPAPIITPTTEAVLPPPSASLSSSQSQSQSPSPLPLPLHLTPTSTHMSLSLSPSPSPACASHATALTNNIGGSGMAAIAAMSELDMVQCTSFRKPLAATKTTSLPLPLLSHKCTMRSVSGGAVMPSSSAAASTAGQALCWRNTLRRMFQRK